MEREGATQTHRQRSPSTGSPLQWPQQLGLGQGQSHKPGTPAKSATWTAEASGLGSSSATFPGMPAKGSWMRSRAARTPSGTPVQDASLAPCATGKPLLVTLGVPWLLDDITVLAPFSFTQPPLPWVPVFLWLFPVCPNSPSHQSLDEDLCTPGGTTFSDSGWAWILGATVQSSPLHLCENQSHSFIYMTVLMKIRYWLPFYSSHQGKFFLLIFTIVLR